MIELRPAPTPTPISSPDHPAEDGPPRLLLRLPLRAGGEARPVHHVQKEGRPAGFFSKKKYSRSLFDLNFSEKALFSPNLS